jgi:acetyltransferase-like isoleucine patch superfamily enzyme
MAGSIVQANARIGKHCIINTGATVDHDCIVEDYAHIAPGAHLCGGVHVGEGALVGVSVGLEPGTHVPAWHIVKRNGYRVERARDF